MIMDRFDPKHFKKKTAAVLGLGRSGIAVANLLARKGFHVLASDTRPRADVKASAAKLHPKVKWEAGEHSARLLKCGFAVKSPGIPSHAPVLAHLKRAGIPVFSEMEISLAFCKSDRIVAITGTNGKTTTTLLTAEIFKAARKKTHVAGNVGVPLAAMAPKIGKSDTLVLEVSSYQLEDSRYFHPNAATILNVTADHVDHHGSMARYIEAKARVFRRQNKDDACVFNAADPITVKLSRQCHARRLFFSVDKTSMSHAWVEGGRIVVAPAKGKSKEIRLSPPKLPGAHNLENAMAAALLTLELGVPAKAIQKAFNSFDGVEHRIEDCGAPRGIRCINDSKATNVESTITALKALAAGRDKTANVLLILGGLHKGYPYTPLRVFLGSPVKGILTIGSAAGKVEEDLSGHVPILPCGTIEQAVQTGLQIAEKGDILLLSPACASFDQFKDYEHRGRRFKELVESAGKAK